jgi:hypothetical protein
MRYRPAARVLVVLLLAIVTVAGVVVARRNGGTELVLLLVFLTVAFLMLGAAAFNVLGTAHRLDADGIVRVAPRKARVHIRWIDVVSIQWSPNARWYELESRRGDRIRVEPQLTNIEAFARAALDGIPPEVIDARPELRKQLEDTARGIDPRDDRDPEYWRPG